jgi:glutathione synthase/RimK-type ligase-like ATP-grasp enzyme
VLGLVTCAAARPLDTDLPLLVAELPEARIVTWDDPTVDWSAFGAVVIRSTWDYHAHLEQFLDWAGRVAAMTSLWNPPQLIEWNVDKRYLLELAASGIPIVPTQVVGADDERPPCEGDIVVKPSIGAGSVGVRRFTDDPAGAHEHIDVLHGRGAVAMVQQYVAEIDAHGETGMVFIGGVFSHAFRKEPILASTIQWEASDGQQGMFARERTAATTPSAPELAVAELVVATLPATAYARVDLLPTGDGPVVLELEVIEPSLFLHLDPASPARAAAVFRNLVT